MLIFFLANWKFAWLQIDDVFTITLYIQPEQMNMAVFFWYLVQSTLLYTRKLDKSRFTRYQKHTAMYNWSCTL